jgi:hypothetical protein
MSDGHLAAAIGCGTQGLPRSASYSTTMSRPPGFRANEIERRTGVALVVQRVRDDHAVQRRQVESEREVSPMLAQRDRRVSRRHLPRQLPQRPRLSIHGVDRRAWTEQLRQRERECAAAAPEVRPDATRVHATAQQRHMVGMVHRSQVSVVGGYRQAP